MTAATEIRTVSSAPGNTIIAYDCPACGEEVEAHAWSFAGSGKRCPACGVVAGKRDGRAVAAHLKENP